MISHINVIYAFIKMHLFPVCSNGGYLMKQLLIFYIEH